MIDFPSLFTKEQIDYIGRSVVAAARLVCGDRLRDVILFGSYARGDFQEWSDVDVIVLADANDAKCRQISELITEELFDLIYHMNLLLSFLVTPYAHFENMKDIYPFYRNIDKEGIRLCSMSVV
jgi:predicted nucleotidyltransferase